MSEETSPIVVTLKGGRDYDAPWLVIRGNRPEEVANMLSNLGNLPEVIAQQAQLFAGTVSAGPVLQQQEQPAQAPAAQPAWGTVTGQGFQPAQQGQAWQSGQQAPPQQQGGQSKFAGTPHPEGRPCEVCGKVLEHKKTSNGNMVWRCPEWRWNNGNPNNHTALRPGE